MNTDRCTLLFMRRNILRAIIKLFKLSTVNTRIRRCGKILASRLPTLLVNRRGIGVCLKHSWRAQ